MAVIDIIILIPLLFGAYKGFTKGFVMEITTLLAFVLGIIGGFTLLDAFLVYVKPYFGDEMSPYIPYIGFLLLFVGIVLIVYLLGKFVQKSLKVVMLSPFDHVAGAILGVLKWVFGLSVLLWLSNEIGIIIPKEAEDEALLFPILKEVAPVVIDYSSALLPFTKGLIESINELLGSQSA